jgi:copper(I)-binding protein
MKASLMTFRSMLNAARNLVPAVVLCYVLPANAADVSVDDPWVRGTVAGQMATGAFMAITAKEGAALISASTPVAGVVEIHTMKMEGGVMKMRPIPKLELPAGEAVHLKPGGYHVMLMDLKQPLKTGESVPITLKLEGKDKAVTTLDIKAEVRPLNAAVPTEGLQHHKH